MDKKYLRENKNSFNIVKNSKIYAKVPDFDDAIFIRNLLIEHNWNLNQFPQIIRKNDVYLVIPIIDDKIQLIGKYETKPNILTVNRLIKNFKRNPNNSEYGLNILKVFDTFVIKKQIAGDDYIFGYYGTFEDARFVRNFLLDNNWNVDAFREIEFDDETNSYRVVRVIDDHVYVLANFIIKSQINLQEVYEEFLAKVSKHKYGLAQYPHLDLLKDKIPELEVEFQVKTKDKKWSFENVDENESILTQVIFNLTPFQQTVLNSINSNTSFDEIKKSLIRYNSKNFDKKILKNLDELIEMDLIEKTDDTYSKTNF